MQFRLSYLLGLNELVGLAYVQNLGLLMKRAPVVHFKAFSDLKLKPVYM